STLTCTSPPAVDVHCWFTPPVQVQIRTAPPASSRHLPDTGLINGLTVKADAESGTTVATAMIRSSARTSRKPVRIAAPANIGGMSGSIGLYLRDLRDARGIVELVYQVRPQTSDQWTQNSPGSTPYARDEYSTPRTHPHPWRT